MLRLEDLAELAREFAEEIPSEVKEFPLAGKRFLFNSQPAVMGVVNLSAESWYRESVCLTADAAISRAKMLCAQGADIIDVGAESTLAHASRVTGEQQTSVLLPVVRQLRSEGILVSVETYAPEVTRACLEAGANVINLTGVENCEEMFRMVADHDAAVIICYIQGINVREVRDLLFDGDPIDKMRSYFTHMVDMATSRGVSKIIIDPGLGFYYRNLQDSGERVRHQMQIFLNTFRLRTLGWPICHALPHAFEYFGEEVRSAEPFFCVLAALGKTDLFRTHEVPKIRAVLETMRSY